VGPARTTIAEIARRAGVQRLTVYKHFPSDSELFAACSGHYAAAHPWPDLSEPLALEDPRERVRAVLSRLYPFYRENERMTANVQRDRLLMPALDQRVATTIDAPTAAIAAALVEGFDASGRQAERARALVTLALDFWTWRRLKDQLEDSDAAELMADAISSSAYANERLGEPGLSR
jgi:AcrR family transcriptional regulator